jgi:hypothetical protein
MAARSDDDTSTPSLSEAPDTQSENEEPPKKMVVKLPTLKKRKKLIQTTLPQSYVDEVNRKKKARSTPQVEEMQKDTSKEEKSEAARMEKEEKAEKVAKVRMEKERREHEA